MGTAYAKAPGESSAKCRHSVRFLSRCRRLHSSGRGRGSMRNHRAPGLPLALKRRREPAVSSPWCFRAWRSCASSLARGDGGSRMKMEVSLPTPYQCISARDESSPLGRFVLDRRISHACRARALQGTGPPCQLVEHAPPYHRATRLGQHVDRRGNAGSRAARGRSGPGRKQPRASPVNAG